MRWLVTQHVEDPSKLAKQLQKAAGLTPRGGSGLAGFLATPTLADHVTIISPEQLAAEWRQATGAAT